VPRSQAWRADVFDKFGKQVGFATTDTSGAYLVDGLLPSAAGYTVCFDATRVTSANVNGYASECNANVGWAGGDFAAVPAGTALTPVAVEPLRRRRGTRERWVDHGQDDRGRGWRSGAVRHRARVQRQRPLRGVGTDCDRRHLHGQELVAVGVGLQGVLRHDVRVHGTTAGAAVLAQRGLGRDVAALWASGSPRRAQRWSR